MDQILSLCSGIGGLDLGLHEGLRAVGREPRTICMVEREAFSVAILGKAMQEGRLDECPVWCGDLRDLPCEELPAIDWITGGYPCQPFSHAGKRMGEDDHRHLWPAILDLVRTLRPGGVFFENVAGHMSLGLDRVLQDLAGCGYRSAFGLFTAEEVGAPHRRERVFILGLADAEDNDRRSRVGGKEEGTRPNDERRRRPGIGSTALADGEREGLEGDLPNPDEEGREDEGGPPPRCREDRGGWRRVVFCADCDGDHEGGELFCPCGVDYIECRSPGPTEDGFEYGEADGVLYGRRLLEWPRRPGQPQHEGEPPRTTQPRLGRDAHGLPDRVDRLRALGNAVVWQQAARAFETLYKELAC